MYRIFYDLPMCFIVLGGLFLIFVYYLVYKQIHLKLKHRQRIVYLIWTVVFCVYILFVIYVTVLNRERINQSINFEFFWSYQYILKNKSVDIYYEVVLNILLYIPFGLLGANLILSDNKKNIIKYAAFVSILIEISQIVFRLGLGEIDDIFNNILGAYVGYQLSLIMNIKLTKECLVSIFKLSVIMLVYTGIWFYITV